MKVLHRKQGRKLKRHLKRQATKAERKRVILKMRARRVTDQMGL